MNVTLTRNIPLQSAVVYLKLEREVFRKDVQDYLNGKKFPNEVVERRTREYLKSIGIYDESYHLTRYGEQVKETGMVKTLEEGKYQIWFTQGDSFFGNKIFYFKRRQPQSQVNIQNRPFQIGRKENYCLSAGQNEFIWFDLLSDINNGEPPKPEAPISFKWQWKNLDSSSFAFSGQIAEFKIADNTAFGGPKNLRQKIVEILPDWDAATERYKIPLSAVNDSDSVSFEYQYNDSWKDFKVHIDALPVEPYNETEAREWRNKLLDRELAEDYFHPKDFENTVASLNEKDGFTAYKETLDSPKAENYRATLLRNKKSETSPAYWHLSAPLDLNPDTPRDVIKQSFTLSQGEACSFRDITQKIWSAPVDKVFYYDKYVISEGQQKKTAALFGAFSCNKAYLITNTADNKKSDYIEKHHPHIVRKNLKELFKNGMPQHDRYLILSNGEQLEVWNISNSTDFIRFIGDVTADAKGAIEQSVVFSNVAPKILHKELRQFIEEERKRK